MEKRPPLNKRSSVPLYVQLKRVIEGLIDSGRWPPDTQVPSERDLCQQYDISRITVRQTLNQLVQEGRLVRSHGRGTFVANEVLNKPMMQVIGFSEEIRARGQIPGARVLRFARQAASGRVAAELKLRGDSEVYLVRRLRLANDIPMAVETVQLPVMLCPGLSKEQLENQSLYETLTQSYRITPTRALQQWQAVACPAADARLLGIAPRRPVLRIQRTTFEQGGVPFESLDSYFRGDRYIFHAELHNQ